MMVPIIMATVVLELPVTIISALASSAMVAKKTGGHAVSQMFETMVEGSHFFNFFIIVLIEELFARWFFLGVLTAIPGFGGVFMFYVLFLFGNGLWALIHLANFNKSEDRNPLRTLPQFMAGIFFTYVYVKYGLLATVLAHFASNAILFSTHRIQNVDLIDFMIVVYSLLVTAVSYSRMEKPLTDILVWFADEPTFRIPGWEFWDYVKVSIFITSGLALVSGILLYDRGDAGKGKEKKSSMLDEIIAIPIIVLLLCFIYWVLGWFVGSVPYRILILAILLTFAQRSESGSAMARCFWVSLPDIYVSICLLQVFSFFVACEWLAFEMIVHAPRAWLTHHDD